MSRDRQQRPLVEKMATPVSQESSPTAPLVTQSKFPTYKMNGPETQEDPTNAKQEQCADRQQRHLVEELASTVSQASSSITHPVSNIKLPIQEDQINPEQEQSLNKQPGSLVEEVASPVSQPSSTITLPVSKPNITTYKTYGP